MMRLVRDSDRGSAHFSGTCAAAEGGGLCWGIPAPSFPSTAQTQCCSPGSVSRKGSICSVQKRDIFVGAKRKKIPAFYSMILTAVSGGVQQGMQWSKKENKWEKCKQCKPHASSVTTSPHYKHLLFFHFCWRNYFHCATMF